MFVVKVFKVIGLSILIFVGALSLNSAKAWSNSDITYIQNKLGHLETSVKRNYLGIKNLDTWNGYLNDAKRKNSGLPQNSTKDNLDQRIYSDESLLYAVEYINYVEISMEKNAKAMRNADVWQQRLELAKVHLKYVDLKVFKEQYNALYQRLNSKLVEVVKIKNDYMKEYNKANGLYEEAFKLSKSDKDLAINKANESKELANKLSSYYLKDRLINNIDNLIKGLS